MRASAARELRGSGDKNFSVDLKVMFKVPGRSAQPTVLSEEGFFLVEVFPILVNSF